MAYQGAGRIVSHSLAHYGASGVTVAHQAHQGVHIGMHRFEDPTRAYQGKASRAYHCISISGVLAHHGVHQYAPQASCHYY
jgi:carboxylesterase type B